MIAAHDLTKFFYNHPSAVGFQPTFYSFSKLLAQAPLALHQMRILMKVLGSGIAPCIAAAVGIVVMRFADWSDWRACGLMIGLFVIPVWLWVLLPLYLLLPRSSTLWRPIICSSLGGISGAILAIVYFALSLDAPFEVVLLYLPFAVLIGSVTCFVGALTARSP